MGAFIVRQPNGLICRFSTVVDCPTHWNMTDEEYVAMCMEEARDEARDTLKNHLLPFESVDNYFVPDKMTEEEFKKVLEQMNMPAEAVHEGAYTDEDLEDGKCGTDKEV